MIRNRLSLSDTPDALGSREAVPNPRAPTCLSGYEGRIQSCGEDHRTSRPAPQPGRFCVTVVRTARLSRETSTIEMNRSPAEHIRLEVLGDRDVEDGAVALTNAVHQFLR